MQNFSLFVTCAPEIEFLLAEELKELGIHSVTLGHRGVSITEANWSTIYTINYASRLANRVLLPLSRFKCYNQKSLYSHISKIDWVPFFKKSMTLAIDANVHHKELRNSLFAAQVVKDAICDQMRHRTGNRPSVDVQNPDIQLNLFIHQDWGCLSFDTSGEPLHKRGYRIETVEAPIQETLAAAILRIAGYSSDQILLDPCCGSGTILIEAALMAARISPGYIRKKWGFHLHPQHDQTLWLKIKNQFDSLRIPLQPHRFFGLDINKNAVRVSKVNLKAAGFGNEVEISQNDFQEYIPNVLPNLLITNPPHGRRLEDVSMLKPFYRKLGEFIKNQVSKPGRAFIFIGNQDLMKETGLAAKRRHVLMSGGIDSRLLEFDLY